MDIPELKPNKCNAMFTCSALPFDDCVYYRPVDGSEKCRYFSHGCCSSSVAAVNRMVVTLQSMGINFNQETYNG